MLKIGSYRISLFAITYIGEDAQGVYVNFIGGGAPLPLTKELGAELYAALDAEEARANSFGAWQDSTEPEPQPATVQGQQPAQAEAPAGVQQDAQQQAPTDQV